MLRKDGRIQIYYKDSMTQKGSTVVKNYRHFIYSVDLFEKGGVYFRATALKAEDAVNSSIAVEKEPVKFVVNRNPKIDQNQKVIFDGQVYDISYIDPYDFRSRQMTFVAVKSSDTTKYAGDIYD